MVYTGINILSAFPNEAIQINLNGDIPVSIMSNLLVRFYRLSDRFGQVVNTQYLYSPQSPSILYKEIDDNQFQFINLPSISSVIWEIGNNSEYFLTLYLEGTSENYINLAPTRIIPTFQKINDTSSFAVINVSPPYVFTSSQDVLYASENRNQLAYFNNLPSSSVSALFLSSGIPYVTTFISDNELFQTAGSTTYISGSLNKKISKFDLTIQTRIGQNDFVLKAVPSLLDNTKLETLFLSGNTSSYTCGVSALTGNVNYNTGEWDITFNCGESVPFSKIAGSYIEHNEIPTASVTISSNSGSAIFTGNYPLYLYETDILASTDNVKYIHAFRLKYNLNALVENDFSTNVKITPKFEDYTGQITTNIIDGYSKWRLLYEDSNIVARTPSNAIYNFGTWVDPSAVSYVTVSPSDDDEFTFAAIAMEVSSTNGRIETDFLIVSLNSADASFDISATPIEGIPYAYNIFVLDNSTLNTNPNSLIKWSGGEESNNMRIESCNGGELNFDSPIDYQIASCINVYDVTPGGADFTFYSYEYDLSSTYILESPEDDGFLKDYEFNLDIFEVDSCYLNQQISAKAFFKDINTGFEFPPPSFGDLIWSLSSENDNLNIEAYDRSGNFLSIGNEIEAIDSDFISLIIKSIDESDVSIGGDLVIGVKYVGVSGFEAESEFKSFPFSSSPDSNLYSPYFNVISGSEIIGTSRNNKKIPIPLGVHTLKIEIENDLPFVFFEDNLSFIVNNTTYNGVSSQSITLNFGSNSTFDVELLASGINIPGWDKEFCLESKLELTSNSVSDLNILAFPRNRWGGSSLLLLNWDNYTQSYGNTAYGEGHTETFYLSGPPGFDIYNWSILNFTKTTTENRTTLQVTPSIGDYNTPIKINLTAYKNEFGLDYPFYGETKNTTKFNSDIVFLEYPGLEISAHSTETLFNFNNTIETEFKIPFNIIGIVKPNIPSPLSIVNGGEITVVLSGDNILKTKTIPLNSNTFNQQHFFTLNENDIFSIYKNTFNEMVICLSANANCKIPTYNDFQSRLIDSDLYCIPISAIDGPLLSIFLNENCVSSGEIIWFENRTPSFPGYSFSNFTFNDGNGNITNTNTISSPLSGFYTNSGFYTPSLSSVLNGNPVTLDFKNFVIVDCGTGCEKYNKNINRTFPDNLKFPNTLLNLQLSPNEILTHTRFNILIDKLEQNFNYLIDKSKAYSLDIPTAIIKEIYNPNIGLNKKDWRFRDKYTFSLTNNGNILIENIEDIENEKLPYESRIKIVKNDDLITEGERFKKPISIDVNNNGTIFSVIDGGDQSVFFFSFDKNTEIINLLVYWGGLGDTNSKTKFKNAIKVIFGQDDDIFIIDSGNNVIKKYNKYYNWVSNIFHSDWSNDDINIHHATNNDVGDLFVICDNKRVYKFLESGEFVNSFSVKELGEIRVNKFYDGSLYIISNSNVIKYTIDGVEINYWLRPIIKNSDKIYGFDQTGSTIKIITQNYIYYVFDCLKVDNLRNTEIDSEFFPFESMKVEKDEFIQDWCINDILIKIENNLNLFYNSITNRFITYKNPFDPNKIEYFLSPISGFEVDYYNDNIIGINEFVSFEVLNRCVERIYNKMETILNSLRSIPKNYEENCQFVLNWKKTSSNNTIQYSNCESNPLSWIELKGLGITNWYGLSTGIGESTEYELINFNLNNVRNLVPTKIENCNLINK